MVRATRVWGLASAMIGGCMISACSRPARPDVAVGTLEVVEVDVGPLQPARALQVLVQEGDAVRVGDTLALFTTPTLASATAQADARAVAAREASRELARGARPGELNRAAAELRVTEADAERTAADLVRLEPLAAAGDVSRASLDAARAAARAAAGRRDAAREALRLLEAGARSERRVAAAAEARGAAAAVEGWRATASDLVLLSPVHGKLEPRRLAEWILRDHLPVRMQLQLHKLLWGEKPGH